MESKISSHQDRTAVVADVGRHAISVGLTDMRGVLVHDSVRIYKSATQPTVAGAISTFGREAGLARLPHRIAVSVAGIRRGDTISVTNGQWRVSRSGLAAMLQATPLIVNDFAATAWAISSAQSSGKLEAVAGQGARPQDAGTFCVIGLGSGLGVAVISRDPSGLVGIAPTEAGNCAFPSGLKEAEPLLGVLGARHGYATSEMLVSAPGLVAIYAAIAKARQAAPMASDAMDVVRLGLGGRDPLAAEALTVFAKAFWHLAGNLVLGSGAWDGVILTGGLAVALHSYLQRPELIDCFALRGAYRRILTGVPCSVVTFRHAELEGAAVALLAEEARRTFAGGTSEL